VLIALAVTFVMNLAAGLVTARIYGFGPRPAANVATTLLARGEFALILATMAAAAGLDDRLSPFIAGYVLVLAVVAPLVAGRSHRLARLMPGGPRDDGDVDDGDVQPDRPEPVRA
jgi:CPA2 family monovalent cation:H+ antiporter-2